MTVFMAGEQVAVGVGYRVLGEIAVAGRTVTRRRERELLGLLVAARGRSVPVERVIDELWSGEAPRSAVQVIVSRLRAMLDPARSGSTAVETTPAGYHVVATQAEVDVWTFEDLAERSLAGSTPADRLVLATRAVELWTGEPYAECRAPSLRAEATRLADLLVTVQESRAEALLALGHAAAAARLLAPVTREHPYRESVWALLARAQYACARQADALSTLATLRTRLVEDLGVDPSPVVRATEHAILTQGAGLTPPSAGRADHRPRIRVAGRCRAVSARYVMAHTPVAALPATGTMTG